ncbi:MAG: GntR family transcriptional regulator [Thalassobaculales bacterium]
MEAQLRRTPWMLDRSRQAAPQITEALRARILGLELAPNTVLSRAALQAEFGVSQTPLRDALMKLEQEGLVEVYPQHATVVARIDLGAARQAHFLRMAIELEAVRRVAQQPAGPHLEAAARAIEAQRRAQAEADYDAFSAADRGFHKIFYDAAGVPDLWHIVRRQSGHIDRLRLLNLPLQGKIEQVIADHSAVLEAVRRGEPEAAAEALRRHLSGTLSIIDQIRQRHPDYLRGE